MKKVLRRDSGSAIDCAARWAFMAALVVPGGALSLGAASPSWAQQPSSTQLPPVSVEATKARPKTKVQAKARPQSQPSAAVSEAPSPEKQPPIPGARGTATGPVDGIVAVDSASATRTDTRLIETPQTVNVVGRPQMEQQGADTVSEALRYTPGIVTGTAGPQSDRHDSYWVRGEGGFSAAAQYASMLDGMRWRFPDRTSVQFDPWMLERVEVVKGPSSALFGASTPGGIVNLVSKRPSFEKRNEVFATFGNFDSMGVGFDFTGPVNNQLAYRFIGLGKKSENGVDFQEGERFMFAPSFTLRPTDATTITISALYQRDPKSLDAGFVPAYGSVLPIPGFGKVPKSFWQGDPAWNEFDRTQAYIGLEFQHRFSEDWKVTARMRYGHQESTTKAMDYTAMVDPTTMMRTIYLAEHDSNMFNADVFTERKFTTGALQHTVVLGVDHQKLTGGFEDGWDRFQYPTINIFNPVRGVTPNAFDTFRVFEQPFEQTGVYLQDQIALGGLRLMGGLRYDRAQSSSSVLVTLNGLSTEASTTDTELTGRVGAAYVFDNGFAPFISYGTSFNPQPAFKPDGSMLTPYTGKMLEAGVRYQSPNSRLFWSATAYTGIKDGVGATAACTFPGAIGLDRCFTDDTEADNKGIELEARAELYSGLDVIASATWQNVRWTEVAGIAVDNHVVGVPDRMAALWLNYTVPEGMFGYGWSVGGGVRYIGTTYATDSNVWGASEGAYAGEPSKVDAFTLFDAAVGYDFKALSREYDGIKARLTASNLFDKSFVAACNGYGTCSFGKGREVLLKLSYTW